MRTYFIRTAAIAAVFSGNIGFVALASGPHPDQSSTSPFVSEPQSILAQAVPDSSSASTTGLASPAAASKLPSPQDAAAHDPAVFAKDKLPTLAHTFELNKEQEQAIAQNIPQDKQGAAATPAIKPEVEVSALLPESGETRALPDKLIQQMPWLKPYRYALLNDKIALVDPINSNVVVEIIDQ